ncbi:hypothetical protein FXO38_33654 [Capsicum annuum]|nr:hypothetical protein FXO38_33654 [Capsicum annuum]KAF3677448.1 hypothetical protein FXO37_04819 [Capsicum annuum]
MRGMKGEILLNMPAEKAWEMYRDNDIISKINPQMLAKAEYVQGDGEPGSLRCFHLGPGKSFMSLCCHMDTPSASKYFDSRGVRINMVVSRLILRALSNYVKQSIEKIEKVEEGRLVTYQVIDGDLRKMYNPYIVTFSFIPVQGNSNQCVAEWKAEYEPIAPAIPTPEKARDAALSFLKSFG